MSRPIPTLTAARRREIEDEAAEIGAYYDRMEPLSDDEERKLDEDIRRAGMAQPTLAAALAKTRRSETAWRNKIERQRARKGGW